VTHSRQRPIIFWEFGELVAAEAASCALLAYVWRKGGWRDVWKFLSGSFFRPLILDGGEHIQELPRT
jgi:hypothetical protein